MSKIVSLSEAASIALHGMILVGRAKNGLNVIKIAEDIGSSKHHVAKVMQRLVKSGHLTSQRGPNGGFVIKKDPAQISFLEIYEIIEGPIEITKCPMDKQVCPFDKCIMNNVAAKLTKEFKAYLSDQTLDKYI